MNIATASKSGRWPSVRRARGARADVVRWSREHWAAAPGGRIPEMVRMSGGPGSGVDEAVARLTAPARPSLESQAKASLTSI